MTRRAPARRAVRRWGLRLARREWRSHVLVTTLIAVSVAAAVLAATAAAHMAPSRAAEMGTADHRIETGITDHQAVAPFLEAARDWFGTIDVIGRRSVGVAGSSTPVELRAHEARGVYSQGMVTVRAGRRPVAPDEVALTDEVAARLGVDVGDGVVLDGVDRAVVGSVEDPEDLDDEFALVPPAALDRPDSVTVLVRADPDRVREFRPAAEPGTGLVEQRGQDESTTAALVVLVVATVALLLVSLVAGAAFVSVAHRRLRQLGMLAAVGATPRQLRAAMVADGAAVGVVAGVLGTASGLAVWLAGAGLLERPAGHRIDRLAIPVWLVAAGMVLAVLTATVAAWWPARAAARVPVTRALSGRPPEPRPTRRPLLVAAVLVAVGVTGIALGVDPHAEEVVAPFLVPGLLAMGAAAVATAGPALRAAARATSRLPVAIRLPARDLARAEARAAAALGAMTLGLGLAVAVVVLAAAAEPLPEGGNLSDRQVVAWAAGRADVGGLQAPELAPPDVAGAEAAVARIAAEVGGDPAVVALDVAVDPTTPERRGDQVLLDVAFLGRPVGGGTLRDSGRVYVATPAVLRHLAIDPAGIDDDVLLLTTQPGPVHITGDIARTAFRADPVPAGRVQRIDVPDRSSLPRTLITEAGLEAAGLEPVRAGWLIEADHRIDPASLGRAEEVAAEAGLTVEGRDAPGRFRPVRTGATAVGAVLALGIAALTLGLLRSEGAHDQRTLAALGATSGTRRAAQATTAGLLSGLGVVVGAALAYAAVIAGYWGDTARLGQVPVVHLTALVVGLPVVAVAASWVVGGPTPTALARRPLD